MTSEEIESSNNEQSNILLCSQCQKSLNPYNFYSFRKYEKNDDDEFLKESFDFCSKECLKKFLESGASYSGFVFYEISRCVGYYDCERLDNLRRVCESKERKSLSNPIFPLVPDFVMAPVCSPGEVGIIKSNIRLLDLFDKFDKVSTTLNEEMLVHTKQMKILTWVLLLISILNLVLLFYQSFGKWIVGVFFGAE